MVIYPKQKQKQKPIIRCSQSSPLKWSLGIHDFQPFLRVYTLWFNFTLGTYNLVFLLVLKRFSFERRNVIGFASTTLHDWSKKLAPYFHPIRSETRTSCNSFAYVFPRFASATCNYFEFWLVHWIICVLCDWLEWLLLILVLWYSIENRSMFIII